MNYPGRTFDDTTQALLAPVDYQNPTPKGRYHLVIVGAGPAGLISAIGAAGLGAKVALIERHRMGGDCLNVGCVPSIRPITRRRILAVRSAGCVRCAPRLHPTIRSSVTAKPV